MATLICTQYPSLGIFVPATGEWINFQGGKLDIEEDHPHYALVMSEASRNPAIAVYVNASTCIHCGETTQSKAKLEAHVKDAHFDKWLADSDAKHAETRIAEIKARAGVVCDACTPPVEVANEDDLALHVAAMHTDKPDLGEDGSGDPGVKRGGRRRPGEVDSGIPAATGSQK